LISENPELHHSYFTEILRYKKVKKMDGLVIKAFASLMSRSIAILRVERNYNTSELGCESNYLYLENDKQLALNKTR
jgi:hypothetical protein